SNWTTDAGGTVNPGGLPTSITDVTFAASSPGTLATTLGADFTVNSLTFSASVGTVSIGGSNTLTISNSTGITVNTGAAVTISATGVILGASQTWTNNSATALTVSS